MNAYLIENELSKITSHITTGNFIQSEVIEKTTPAKNRIASHSYGVEIKFPKLSKPVFFELYFRIENDRTIENDAVVSFKRDSLFYPYVAYTQDSESPTGISFIDLFGYESGVDLSVLREKLESLLPYAIYLDKTAEKFQSRIIRSSNAISYGREYGMLASS